jgi:glycosyltransferase involved in cell wall biosynthesis
MKKKLIIFIPSIEDGGVEKNLFNILNSLAKDSINIFLVTSSKKHNYKFDKKIKILNPFFFNDKVSRYKKYFSSLILLTCLLLRNKNCVVLSFQANIYCSILCQLLKVPVAIRSNTSIYGWSSNFFKYCIYRKVLSSVDKIIVNSKELQLEYKKKFNIKNTVTCIYNPLDTKKIIKLSKVKNKFSFFSDKRFIKIINIGRLVDQKDHITLLKFILEARKEFKIKLLIVGDGSLKNKLLNFVNHNHLSNIVKIIKFQSNPYKYLKKSDVFILTSKFEGLPNVLLEAQLLNKFVISSDCPTGPKEILLNGKLGFLFKRGNFLDLLKKFRFFKKNKNIIKRKIVLARKKLNRFDYNSNIRLYKKVVFELFSFIK